MGAGLGASAALSVALTRFFIAYDWLDEAQFFAFAKRLEDFFHGKSSGVDIAGVGTAAGIYFQQGEMTPIHMAWQPCWILSSCGQRGLTADCVNKVQDLWEHDADKAQKIDEKMATAVQTAKQALEDVNRPVILLKEAINSASECFEEWGLISESLAHHLSQLKSLGAIAAKPTGSGKGGYVMSLWDSLPDDTILTYIEA
jgi:mevalonate kinase